MHGGLGGQACSKGLERKYNPRALLKQPVGGSMLLKMAPWLPWWVKWSPPLDFCIVVSVLLLANKNIQTARMMEQFTWMLNGFTFRPKRNDRVELLPQQYHYISGIQIFDSTPYLPNIALQLTSSLSIAEDKQRFWCGWFLWKTLAHSMSSFNTHVLTQITSFHNYIYHLAPASFCFHHHEVHPNLFCDRSLYSAKGLSGVVNSRNKSWTTFGASMLHFCLLSRPNSSIHMWVIAFCSNYQQEKG